jgi:integrase
MKLRSETQHCQVWAFTYENDLNRHVPKLEQLKTAPRFVLNPFGPSASGNFAAGAPLVRDCVLHSCRHTFGTRLGMAGADVFTIQAALGHASAAMSQRYVHPTSDSLKRAVRGMLEFDQKSKDVQSR